MYSEVWWSDSRVDQLGLRPLHFALPVYMCGEVSRLFTVSVATSYLMRQHPWHTPSFLCQDTPSLLCLGSTARQLQLPLPGATRGYIRAAQKGGQQCVFRNQRKTNSTQVNQNIFITILDNNILYYMEVVSHTV